MGEADKTACRTPTAGREGVVNIPTWKYDTVRTAILDAVRQTGDEGLPFAALTGAVRERLPEGVRERIGSVGWHVATVKLNMEVEGELRRLPGRGPQRLVAV